MKRYFSYPKNQYLSLVFLNFKEALEFWALGQNYNASLKLRTT